MTIGYQCPSCKRFGITKARKLLVLLGMPARCGYCGSLARPPIWWGVLWTLAFAPIVVFPLLFILFTVRWPWHSAVGLLSLSTVSALSWMRFASLKK